MESGKGNSGWQEGLNEGARACPESQILIPSRKTGGRREAFQAERRAHAKVWKQIVRRPFCLKKGVSKGKQRSWEKLGGRSLLIRGSAGMGSLQGFRVGRVQQAETVCCFPTMLGLAMYPWAGCLLGCSSLCEHHPHPCFLPTCLWGPDQRRMSLDSSSTGLRYQTK